MFLCLTHAHAEINVRLCTSALLDLIKRNSLDVATNIYLSTNTWVVLLTVFLITNSRVVLLMSRIYLMMYHSRILFINNDIYTEYTSTP